MNANQKFNDLVEKVTDQVISLLETGTVAWQKPWIMQGGVCNAVSNRSYDGFNAFYLGMVTFVKKYSSGRFLTYKQAAELGGNIKKGEKGYQIVFWSIKNRFTGTKTTEDGEEHQIFKKTFTPILWTVFNVDQTEGIQFAGVETKTKEKSIIAECEQIVAEMPNAPLITFGGSQAFYSPSSDLVKVPSIDTFRTSESFYQVLFHELIHSTGHRSRLDRFNEEEGAAIFGNEKYSKEELVAEMGASFLSAQAGILTETIHQSAAYLEGWLSALKNDKKMLYYAASKAGKAAGYILNAGAEGGTHATETLQAA